MGECDYMLHVYPRAGDMGENYSEDKLEKIFNLRFHPNFNSSEWLWSPVVMIHNHCLSNYFSAHIDDVNQFFQEHNNLRYFINHSFDNSNLINWRPRYVSIESFIDANTNHNSFQA